MKFNIYIGCNLLLVVIMNLGSIKLWKSWSIIMLIFFYKKFNDEDAAWELVKKVKN